MMRVTHDEDTPCSNSTSVTTFLQPLYCTFLYSGRAIELFSQKQEEEQAKKKKQEKNKNQRRLNPFLPKNLC